jgi:MFS family permease
MLIFLFAPDIGWVIAARAVQGIATGAGVSAFTAATAEHAAAKHKKLGVLAGSVAPAAGLGLGALLAGIVVQFTAAPSHIIFTFLAVFFVLGMIVVIASPETAARRGGALRSLTPHVSVPQMARSEFFASIPVHIATWMLGGLYLGLVPSIMHGVFDIDSGLVTGLAILALSGTGALAGFLFSFVPARSAVILGGSLTVPEQPSPCSQLLPAYCHCSSSAASSPAPGSVPRSLAPCASSPRSPRPTSARSFLLPSTW